MSIEKYIDESFEAMLEEIAKIIAVRTVKGEPSDTAPYGEEVKRGLIAVLGLASQLGFKTVNLDNYIGYAEYGEGEEYIAILGHIDIVHEGIGWQVTSPFEAKIFEGNLYGRGVLDNKSPIISCLYSLKALVRAHPEFKTRVRIIFGCNEESGTDDIAHYLSKEKPPLYAFTPDGRFPVIHAEKGMFTCTLAKAFPHDGLNLWAGEKSNVVPDRAAAVFPCGFLLSEDFSAFTKRHGFLIESQNNQGKVNITCMGKAAHAANPRKGKNAIVGLMHFIKEYTSHIGAQEIADFFFTTVGEDVFGKTLGIACEDGDSGPLTQNTAILSYDGKELSLKFNVRYPVSLQGAPIIERFKGQAEKHNALFTLLTHNKPLYFPKNDPFIQVLNSVYQEVTGRQEEPCAVGGGTYAKLMPNTVAFGPNFPELNSRAHQPDEYIPLDTLKAGAVIYAYALKKLGAMVGK